jgi:hypothetical protein
MFQFIALYFIAPCGFCVFHILKVCDNPMLSRPTDDIFPTAHIIALFSNKISLNEGMYIVLQV